MKEKYLDLKEGERLFILENDVPKLFMDAESVKDGTLVYYAQSAVGRRKVFCLPHHFRVEKPIRFYNFGNRGFGRRVHLRVEMPERYEFFRVR